jgi:Cleft lip and palate transmembrane protein 1 (CLPTM1)
MKRWLSWTSLLSTVFVAYFTYTFYALYRVAVPEIPPLESSDGRQKPAISPLWLKAKKGLTFELSLSLAQSLGHKQQKQAKDAAPQELTVLRVDRLPYNWTLGAAVQLEFEIVRNEKAKAPAGLRVFCSDSATDSTSSVDGLAKNPTCRKAAKFLDKSSNCTRSNARGWTARPEDEATGAAFELQGNSLLLTAGKKFMSTWRSLWRSSSSEEEEETQTGPVLLTELIDGAEVTEGVNLSPSEYGVPSLQCAPGGAANSAITARRIATALTSGSVVYAHSKVYWSGSSKAKEEQLLDPTKVLYASTPLVSPTDYRPPKQTRFLLQDPWGTETAERYRQALQVNGTLPVETASKTLLAPQAMDRLKGKKRGGGYTRLFLNTTTGPALPSSSSSSSTSYYLPSTGHDWPYFCGSLDVKLIMDIQPLPRDEIPQQLRPFIRLDPSGAHYIPLLAANPVRPARESYHPLNHSISTPIPLKVTFKPLSIGSWQLLQVMDNALTTQQSLGASDKDTDEVVRLLSDTPLWLLTLTFVVSVFHLLLDLLAIKSDVSFWKSTKSLKGISSRSLFIQLVSNIVITAYLWIEDSSLLVLIPQGLSTLLLVWKLLKALGFVLTTRFGVVPWVTFDASLAATATAETDQYDREAITFMSLALSPLLVGFATYALVYQQFGGWLDYALTTAVTAIYGFGFVLMTPQLWLNYRLKSVAAMPLTVFAYRFFNTIIDDVFAAIITMPMAARLSVFRDDIIFIVLMVQRWKYKTDLTRAAESWEGGGEAPSESRAEAEAKPAAASVSDGDRKGESSRKDD